MQWTCFLFVGMFSDHWLSRQLIISKFSSQIIMQSKNDYVDEKVKSILTDLGYTKTRHHDIYVTYVVNMIIL